MMRIKTGIVGLIVLVLDVRIGSLVVDFEVIMPEDTVPQFLNGTANLLSSTDTIEIDGVAGEVQSLEVESVSYDANSVDSYRCTAFETLEGPCGSGYECVVTDGEAVCSVVKEEDNFRVIIGVGVGVPLGLIAVVFVVVVGIYVNRKTRRSDRSSDSESYEDDRHRFPSKIATRYHGGYGQSPAAVYGPQYFESFSEPQFSSRQPAVPGEPPVDTNFSWDFLYDQYPPGKKFEIRRPKY